MRYPFLRSVALASFVAVGVALAGPAPIQARDAATTAQARAGFDPRAGITLWQKMSASGGREPFAWLSTHPAGQNRIKEIERHLPQVMPIYERSHAR